ncbi:uncharacterized protein LOC127249034 [Andrographis paniculata]|uniref:uncharacterized protein LOC127249034 n=1 Tax=Andrographis paniculata TaxID=175694 RepID=UPI0021E82769|nr:uncharacterized protein LOC127249034 [Andrographis paniculata]
MVSIDSVNPNPSAAVEMISSPRTSFSFDFLDDTNFISISPAAAAAVAQSVDFEFLSPENTAAAGMTTADELFREGKLLPFWQTQFAKKLNAVNLETAAGSAGGQETAAGNGAAGESRIRWLLDDDPSPRPPKCTVLWKELLRLKKQRSSNLSPSSSSYVSELPPESADRRKSPAPAPVSGKEKKRSVVKKMQGGNVRIRPVINVPICSTNSSPLMLPSSRKLRKTRSEVTVNVRTS